MNGNLVGSDLIKKCGEKMKKMKMIIFFIISVVTIGFVDSSVLAIPSINPTTPDEPAAQVTKCVYLANEDNEYFTITYSLQANGNGGVRINWVETSHSKIKLANSYVYSKEFITNGDTITCPNYLNYEISGNASLKTMKVGFRSKYSKKMTLSGEKTINNNIQFAKNNSSIVNTCSYDSSIGGKLYIETYNNGTMQASLSTPAAGTPTSTGLMKVNLHVDTIVTADLFKTSCPKIATGWSLDPDTDEWTIYVMQYDYDFELTFGDQKVNVDMEYRTGTKLNKTGDDIKIMPEENTDEGTGIGDGEINWGDNVDVTCDGILGQELLDFIDKIFGWIRIIAPIFVIIMGSVEFAGAALQDDKDAIKKASSKFIKRLIIAVALFFIPTLLNFLLDIFNEFSKHHAGICGIGQILIK